MSVSLPSLSVAVLHILASGWDQFVGNVLRGEGQLHQILRDLGFMVPDVLHILLPWAELRELAAKRRVPPSHLIADRDFAAAAVSVALLWILCALIT